MLGGVGGPRSNPGPIPIRWFCWFEYLPAMNRPIRVINTEVLASTVPFSLNHLLEDFTNWLKQFKHRSLDREPLKLFSTDARVKRSKDMLLVDIDCVPVSELRNIDSVINRVKLPQRLYLLIRFTQQLCLCFGFELSTAQYT